MTRILLHCDTKLAGRPDFVEVQPTAELPQSVQSAGDADWLVVANALENAEAVDWQSLLDQPADVDRAILAAHADDPIGSALERLPANVAVLSVDVTAGRVVAARGSVLGSWAEDVAGWNVGFGNDAERIEFVPSTGGDPFPATLLPELGPGRPSTALGLHQAIRTAADSTNVEAGLLLLHDFLDESHTLAQASGNRDGDYWHAIMHRREPDPSNSKYWWRRVGDHPVFDELAPLAAPWLEAVGESASGDWDPFAFVDLCERARRSGRSPLADAARHVQFIEMVLLLEHGVRAA